MISRGFRYRLAPTQAQESALEQWAGVTRLVYNLALEQRETWRRQYRATTGHALNFVAQAKEVTALRAEYPWIAAVHSTCLTQALRDLERAFSGFFSGVARFPTYRSRNRHSSFYLRAVDIRVRRLNARWSAVRIPRIGWIKVRWTREMRGDLVNATFSRNALGWHVSFGCRITHVAPANDNPPVGIDRGVAVPLMLSTGEAHSLPTAVSDLDRRKRAAQRRLCRRKRGSKRHAKQARRVARLSGRIARTRADWQHRVSRSIADRFGLVALENLKVVNMTARGSGKRGLNRSILNQGWGAFATKLAYKLEERGGALEFVDPRHTSQACSACGVVDADSRKSQAAFVCTSCGFALNADHNAAINILRRSTSDMLVEGRGCAPAEARTMLEAA